MPTAFEKTSTGSRFGATAPPSIILSQRDRRLHRDGYAHSWLANRRNGSGKSKGSLIIACCLALSDVFAGLLGHPQEYRSYTTSRDTIGGIGEPSFPIESGTDDDVEII
jgi:hypothetical protein